MGRAGKALRQVLETYGISQNRLAVTMGAGRSTVHYWFNNTQDPTAESLLQIIEALQKIDEAAAKDFVRLYLGDIIDIIEGEASEDDQM
ncbi:MAG: helix-turn-helix domain-containing protein [Drouetiella hepatica Uher 2000/2452]|jgi:transcriptional regulator with XRE-family HTH domain|uniref:Helix-turn-helix domain-containing protein n=1 Tax=Drouetiella hepatica Uher 2000/2452 TaxID=904376 RepID=A0A951QBR9_9CYAN|nr:helix-turn-helix domain-containing protein [Drouetiella hepatica Uher 2000/2452]